MPELDGLLAILILGFWLFCIFDVITTPEADVRNLPKGLWLVLVILLVEIGAILWLIAGRPRVAGRSLPYKGNPGSPVRRGRPAGRPVAPDDDPDFLRQLSKSNAEHESLLDQWEADLRRREQQLRDQPEDPQP